MQITLKKAVPALVILLALFLLLLGLAFILNYIPPNGLVGIMPEGEFVDDESWYALNTLGGWALAFCGFTTLVFVIAMRKQKQNLRRYITFVLGQLLLSAILASLILTLVEQLLLNR